MINDSTAVAPKRSGLAVLMDTIVAPSAAFEELRKYAHWGVAFLVTCVLGLIGGYLHTQAIAHMQTYALTHDPRMQGLTSEQLASAKSVSLGFGHFAWLFQPITTIVAIAVTAGVLYLASKIGRGTADFKKLFGLAANVAVISLGIGYLVSGILVTLRGADNFNTAGDVLGVVPSLAWLVPNATGKLQVLLGSFNVFQIWSVVLLALGMRRISGVSAAVAWAAPILLVLLGAVFASASVR